MVNRKYRHPQVNLRLPRDLKEHIAAMADSNKRSANAEMVAAIEAWVRAGNVPGALHEDSKVIMTRQELNDIVSDAAENAMKRIIRELELIPAKSVPE
ncbi:Arc family DNA-binding protein [Pantoea piersonii]|uniref:Arc family DNA-binding protein n=1 Tax=Pantoea piersonii TaxID=2364647 RepID=A0AAJ5QP31_9GAMM|nr:Arc family DNA-binding protein [Pantoea piersonii]WBG93118.1 Arc family DNA-binding protein [Pantoea piersonii]